jgi:hypothetical protein
MTSQPAVLEPLPVEDLCNKIGIPNPIYGFGELGLEVDGKMVYCGSDEKRRELVRTLQSILIFLYDGLENYRDGFFGTETEDAVKVFQRSHTDWDNKPLIADGLVGPRVADSLNRAVKDFVFPIQFYSRYSYFPYSYNRYFRFRYYKTPEDLKGCNHMKE